MQLFQSLICLKGYDNQNRHLAIHGVAVLAGFIIATLFSPWASVYFLLMAFLTILVWTSTKRRFNDVKTSGIGLHVAPLVFLIGALAMYFTNGGLAAALFVISAIISGAIGYLKGPAKRKSTSYVQGYIGPVDLSSYAPTRSAKKGARIEPTLAGTVDESTDTDDSYHESDAQEDWQQTDLLSQSLAGAFTWIQQHRTTAVAVVIALALLSFVPQYISQVSTNDDQLQEQEIPKPKQAELVKNYELAMPDDFWLYMNNDEGVILHWEAATMSSGEVWSIMTASGQMDCSEVDFNTGDSIRTLQVLVENNTDHYAVFSPLDSETLIRALAYRSTFNLCGFSFSLKGSQRVIQSYVPYSDYLPN